MVVLLFRHALTNPGLFHALLAVAARHLNIVSASSDIGIEREILLQQSEATQHLSQAIQDPTQALSDSTIASILCMGSSEVTQPLYSNLHEHAPSDPFAGP